MTETVKDCGAMKMCDTLPPDAVTPSPKSQLKDDAVVPFSPAAVKLTMSPTLGLLGETFTVKGAGGGVLLSFHAVSGWISHPLNWCHVALRFSGSHETNPCTSIKVDEAKVWEARVELSQIVPVPQYPAAFQSWSISA